MKIKILNYKVLYKLPKIIDWQHSLSIYFLAIILTSLPALANNNIPIGTIATASKIVQDKKGFIWLAGQQGLTRYDGEQAITFNSGNSNWPIPFTWLHDVAIDKDKLLLATETDGLWHFNPQTGEATKIPADIPNSTHYDVKYFKGNYYINAPNKLYRFNLEDNTTEIIHNNIHIRELTHTNTHLYVSSKNGLYKLNDRKLTKVINEPINAVTTLSSSVIAVTKSAIFRLNDDGNNLSINIENNIDAVTGELGKNNFFTVSNQGIVNKFSSETLKLLPHKYSNIKPIRVRSFLQDSSGVLWFVSNRGIEQLTENSFINHPKVFDIKINANEVGLYKDEIIIGSYGAGLQNFLTDIFPKSVNNSFTIEGLKISSILSINNTLFVGSFDGLWRLNSKNNEVEKLDFPENNKLILKIKQLDHLLYIGTNDHGVYIYDINTNKVIKTINVDNGLSSSEVIDMLPLNNGVTWLATASTVDILNNRTNVIKSLTLPGKSKVVSLLKSGDKIFAATLGDGIYAFNLQGELLAQFGQGIRFIKMLQVNDEVWVSAAPGLYRFNPDNFQYSMIENTSQYSFVGSILQHKNTIYASHFSGILSLDLTARDHFNAKVHISKTTVSGKSYLLNKAIQIESENDVITFDLASIDFRIGVDKQYKYSLNGGKWNQVNGNQLTLTGLASGEYQIEIMATNSLGQWSNYKAYTNITVAYPWYWTPQIRLIYGVILLSIILIAIWMLYMRNKSISRIHRLLQSDISNYSKTSAQVKRNLTAAMTLIHEKEFNKSTLLLQQCVDALNTQQSLSEPCSLNGANLNEAVPFLAEYLETKYQVKLAYQLELNDLDLDYELQSDLYRVIYEAINSSILSGNGRIFKVVLQKFKNKLWLSITDDNLSFINFTSKVNFNISIYYIRQIANKHNGSINTFNEQGNSSQLVLSLPIIHG